MAKSLTYYTGASIVIQNLCSKISNYLWSIKIDSSPSTDACFKFKSLLLITEIYNIAIDCNNKRTSNLRDYFDGHTLEDCLDAIVTIDNVFENLGEIHDMFCEYDMKTTSLENFDFQKIYSLGPDKAHIDIHNPVADYPLVTDTAIWCGKLNSTNQIGRVFKDAKEELPKELRTRKIEKSRSLGFSANHKFDYCGMVEEMKRLSNEMTCSQIFDELWRSLEMIRWGFMTEAQDIYFIRTKKYNHISSNYDKRELGFCYETLPLIEYYRKRKNVFRSYKVDCKEKLLEWRIKERIDDRKLTANDLEKFLCEEEAYVLFKMEEDQESFKLFEWCRCGYGDTPHVWNKIAHMFYRRPTSNVFLEWEWKRECIYIWKSLVKLRIERERSVCVGKKEKHDDCISFEDIEKTKNKAKDDIIMAIYDFAIMQTDIDHAQPYINMLFSMSNIYSEAPEKANAIMKHFKNRTLLEEKFKGTGNTFIENNYGPLDGDVKEQKIELPMSNNQAIKQIK